MTINLENGKYYELNNGKVYQCKYLTGCYMLGQGYYSKAGIANHHTVDHPLSVKREVEAGTLAELNVKPGDVVEWVGFEYVGHHKLDFVHNGDEYVFDTPKGPFTHILGCSDKFRLISRATETPTLFGDMTDAEKGALLLAKHEGSEIQGWSEWGWVDGMRLNSNNVAYRVKPKPVVETVVLTGSSELGWIFSDAECHKDTHRLTLTITDGDITDVKWGRIDTQPKQS